jgi:hypothetical protein
MLKNTLGKGMALCLLSWLFLLVKPGLPPEDAFLFSGGDGL